MPPVVPLLDCIRQPKWQFQHPLHCQPFCQGDTGLEQVERPCLDVELHCLSVLLLRWEILISVSLLEEILECVQVFTHSIPCYGHLNDDDDDDDNDDDDDDETWGIAIVMMEISQTTILQRELKPNLTITTMMMVIIIISNVNIMHNWSHFGQSNPSQTTAKTMTMLINDDGDDDDDECTR